MLDLLSALPTSGKEHYNRLNDKNLNSISTRSQPFALPHLNVLAI